MSYTTYEVRVHSDGTREWYTNGKLHRTDGPAIEYANGDREWWVDGKLHRTDGPAVEYTDSYRAWYVDGVEMTEAEFKSRSSCAGRVIEVDGKRYRLEAI